MVQFISEPNLWKVIKKEDHDQEKETGIEEIYALVLVYVDDIHLYGRRGGCPDQHDDYHPRGVEDFGS